MRFFRNFFISQPIKLKFGAGIQIWMLILIIGSKSYLGDNFGQYNTKTVILRRRFGQRPLRKSVVMATPKVLGHQKLLERVCYMLNYRKTLRKSVLMATPKVPGDQKLLERVCYMLKL